MEITRVSFGIIAAYTLISAIILFAIEAQSLAPSPAPTSDGLTIDQGIACVLMLVALVLTYLIHTIDVPFNL